MCMILGSSSVLYGVSLHGYTVGIELPLCLEGLKEICRSYDQVFLSLLAKTAYFKSRIPHAAEKRKCVHNYFCTNGVFDKSTRIARFCLRFQRPTQRKSIQNSNKKTCCFEASNLKGFSSNFRCILESKNHHKIANFRKN